MVQDVCASGHHGVGRGERVHGQVEDGCVWWCSRALWVCQAWDYCPSRGLRRTLVRPQVCPPRRGSVLTPQAALRCNWAARSGFPPAPQTAPTPASTCRLPSSPTTRACSTSLPAEQLAQACGPADHAYSFPADRAQFRLRPRLTAWSARPLWSSSIRALTTSW